MKSSCGRAQRAAPPLADAGRLGRCIAGPALPWLLLLLSLICLPCCASPTGTPSQQSLSQLQAQIGQMQAKARNPEFQQQLLDQMSRATLTGYQDYQVGPEDLLEMMFLGLDDLHREVRINGQGEITVPLVGAVKVAGLSPKQVEEKLMALYREREFINNPQITVQVKEYRHQRVMVTGAVAQPGSYEVIGPRTLLEMLGKAGGLNEKAGDVVHLVRHQSAADRAQKVSAAAGPFTPGTETVVIDLRRLLVEGDLKLNVPVQSGDVIHVPFARSAFVLGAVNKPGNVPVKDNLTVTQALALAGGLNPMLSSKTITVVRFNEKGEQDGFTVNLDDALGGRQKDPLVKENDIVFAHESGFRRFLFNFKHLMPGSFGASVPIIP